MNTHTERFDKQLDKIDHFTKFPAMRPYIGMNYDNNGHIKILLIAESNYLPKKSTIQQDANIWYNSHQDNLTDKEINWIHCRQLLECNWSSNGHMIYREIERNLIDYFKPSFQERAMTNVAFMNGFQRPSPKTGESIKYYLTQSDYTVSTDVISQVISIIKSDLVIFVSKLAWDRLNWRLKIDSELKIDFTCHPGTGGRYWNNKNYKHGKEKFRAIISQNIT